MSNTRLDRRDFLKRGIGAAGATLLGASAISCVDDPALPTTPRLPVLIDPGELTEPPLLQSSNGILSSSLTCGTAPVDVAGRKILEAVTYNNLFPGPTLSVRPGDVVDLRLINRIKYDELDRKPGYGRPPRPTRMTNLHFHGLHVSPVGTADNMMVMVDSNDTHRYLFEIPANHPAGLFWYHAHVHGLVTSQVSRGAAGMLVIANSYTDQLTQMGIRRRLMMLQQLYLDEDERDSISDDGNREDPALALSLINGAYMPEIHMRRGEPQVWSLLNASSSAFYKLRLEGHTFDVIARDGIPLRAAETGRDTVLLASGQRVEVVVHASATAGHYALSYDAYNQGVDTWPARDVAKVVVQNRAWTGPTSVSVDSSTWLPDLSSAYVPDDRKRTIVFGTDTSVEEGMFGRFTINGHAWNPEYSEWTSKLGTVEEWLITNETDQEHPFHVHTNPFQITKVNGVPVPFNGFDDVAIIPIGGSITVRTHFQDYAGAPILIHCHILDHEDMGMMTSFQIAP